MLKKLGEAFFEYRSLWKQAGVVLILAAILIVFALVMALTLINAFQKAREEQ